MKKFIIGIVIMLVIAGNVIACAKSSSNQASLAATATIQVKATATPKPTNTPKPAETPKVTATSIPATPIPVAEAKTQPVDAIMPGGLGDTRKSFIAKYGQPKTTAGLDSFQNGKYLTMYSDDRVLNFTVSFEQGAVRNVPIEQARGVVKTLIPRDAQFAKTYDSNGRLIEVYTSIALISLFDSKWFMVRDGPDQPGIFDVIYKQSSPGQVFAITLAIGDNP